MQTKLLFFLLLAATTQLSGQTGFDKNTVIGNSYSTFSPQLVRAADLDGDNDLDIITLGTSFNWYENIGGVGNFGAKKPIASTLNGLTGFSLCVADLDNDGDLDLISSAGNKFSTHKNTDGLGNFQVIQNFTLGINSNPISVAPADMDGDGDLDVVAFYSLSNDRFLVWYPNNGTGTLGAAQIISSDNALIASTLIYPTDLDGDNDIDIIIGNLSYSKILWIKNNGNGTFGAPVTISMLADGITTIAVSDMDQDGDLDIISASKYDNQVVWYKNLDGLGNFSDENIITSNAVATEAVFIADVNGDGSTDVIYSATNEIGWISNTNGLGNFDSPQIITNKAFGVRDLIMGDIDGDGKKDLISASEQDDKVAWYKHDGNGNFGRQEIIARSMEFPTNVYAGDFDGDNDIDLLANSQHDGKLTWLENVNGLGFYGRQHIITENVQVGNLIPIAYPVDIDGDGDLDVASIKNGGLIWYENVDGLGNFTTEHLIDSAMPATIIRSQDIDGDGDKDIVCALYGSNKIVWYANLGNGTFGPVQVITEGSNGGMTSLEIADMDNDGDMDLIASVFDWNVAYFENTNGAGTFTEHNISTDFLYSVYPTDVDGDGDMDIIGVKTAGGGGGTGDHGVVWYENTDGQGNFSDVLDIANVQTQGRSIYATDIDNDGDMDVFVTGGISNSGHLSWFENTGGGTFGARQIIHQTADYTIGLCVTAADVDNDGDQDILSVFGYNGNGTIGEISVFENLGDLGNTIRGKVLIDTDANGCTSNDMKGSNLMVISDNGSHSFATFTDQSGAYEVKTTEGNFTTAITSQLPAYYASNPAAHAFNFSGMNNAYVADFCVLPVGTVNDLAISVYPLDTPRPGFHTGYRIVYSNKGTTTLNGTVDFEFNNNKMSFLTSSQSIASQTANTLTFGFTDLHPFEIKTIDLKFIVALPPVANLNDVLLATATVNPVSGDATVYNNTVLLSQTIIGSYDPNDIRCLEGDQVLIENADQYLHYIIRFQNTGTASAINVKVENTLDPNLDWTTMQLESLSHRGRVAISDGQDVSFIFENINLADSSTNEPASHGFIAYKIKPLANVVVGDVVHNTASIFFDFNPPIVTNPVATQFVSVLSVAENQIDTFHAYPNPTNGQLYVQGNSSINQALLFDLNGRLLKEFHFNSPTLAVQLELSELTKGIYFLKIKSENGITTKKIIKK